MVGEPRETDVWLRGVRQGKADALACLLDHYRPRLRKMVELRMHPRLAARVDPSDVLQEVYLDAASKIRGYIREPKVAFYVWLRGVARDRLLNLQQHHLGAKCRAAERELRLPAESSAVLCRNLLAQGTGPSQAMLREERRQRVERALAKLATEDREAILMRHIEEMPNVEMAQALGLTESGATKRYGRAIARLKDLLLAELADGESRP